MDGDKRLLVICCFCGQGIKIENAVSMTIYPDYNEDESQHLFTHRECLQKLVVKEIPLHPSLLQDDL